MDAAKIQFTSGRTLTVVDLVDIQTMADKTIGFVLSDGGKVVVPLRNVEYIIYGNDEENEVKSAENAELKRLLRLAADDLKQIKRCSTCKNIRADCYPRCIDDCFYEWKYAAEAEKLLGGGESDDKS